MGSASPTGYAVLRDRRAWLGTRTGLDVAADGALELVRVPGTADGQPVDLLGPFDPPSAGLAIGPRGETCLADRAEGRVVVLDGDCGTRVEVSGGEPGPLLEDAGVLIVADQAPGVRVLRFPGLNLARAWSLPRGCDPGALATDAQHRIYLLDAAAGEVTRWHPRGVRDPGFAVTGTAPVALAVATDPGLGELLYVAEAGGVDRFALDGSPAGALPGGGPAAPRALAAGAGRLHVADAASGEIWVYDLAGGAWLGTVAGFQGPVAALVVDPGGGLVVRPGPGEAVVRLAAGAGCVAEGELLAGPFDAGLECGWGRVAARVTGAGAAALDVRGSASAPWTPVPGGDGLAPRADGQAPRLLWLRMRLTSSDRQTGPRLAGLTAETAEPGYLADLPEIYRRSDTERFLADWLELVRSVLGDVETELDDLPASLDPEFAPDAALRRLAEWLGSTPPSGATPATMRRLLADLPQRYRRRGTPAGLRAQVLAETGVPARIVESFTERRIWSLGVASTLGVDTVLAPTDPEGMVVADEESEQPIGGIVLGRSGPLPHDSWATPLLAAAAFRFRVLVHAAELACAERAVADLLDREAPPHTEHHLCVVEPRMRVGVQAAVGLDAVVAAPMAPLPLPDGALDTTTLLAVPPADPLLVRVGSTPVGATRRWPRPTDRGVGCP